MKDVIPEGVFRAIQDHLRERTVFAERGWPAGEDDEDTLTGDFGASLRTSDWMDVKQDGVHYQWRVSYKKTRGKGNDAAETTIGADGVFQVEVQPYNDSLFTTRAFCSKPRSTKEAVAAT